MNIKIRPAAREDVQKTSALYDDFFACNAAQLPENCVAATETGDCPNPVIESGSGDIMIAERDDAVIGFVHVEENAPPPYPSVVPHKYACIIDFFVMREYRRNGAGRLLLDKVKRWAKSRNQEYLELMVWENNGSGRRFYEREHFTTASRTMRLDV